MEKFARYWFLGILISHLLLLPSCHKNTAKENGSETKYLTLHDYRCYPHSTNRINEVKSMFPSGFITNYSDNSLNTVYNRMAGIPDEHLNHLIGNFRRNYFKGIYASSSGGAAGLTFLRSGVVEGVRGMVASAITTTDSDVGMALQHEMGHAVEIMARLQAAKSGIDFNARLQQMYFTYNSNPSKTRSYARINPGESWAESYANYYCSPESRKYIADHFPDQYEFLNKVLPPPIWESGNRANGSNDNNQGISNNDSNLSTQDPMITIAINPQIQNNRLEFSLASTTSIKKVVICISSKDECEKVKTLAGINKFYIPNEHRNGMNFYHNRKLLLKNLQHEITLLGFNDENNCIFGRTVKISKNP